LTTLTHEAGRVIAPPDSDKIQKSSGKIARYIWVICLSRIIGLQSIPVEVCILVAYNFKQIENFATKDHRVPRFGNRRNVLESHPTVSRLFATFNLLGYISETTTSICLQLMP